MEETHQRLRKNRDHLLQQYKSNLEDIFSLQDTLIQDILPSVTDELELCPEAVEWTTDWLCDTSSIFRISRRNKFTKSFSLEAIRKTMIWRLNNMWPLEPSSPMSNLHCLPACDPFGRPILVIRVVPLDEDTKSQKRLIIRAFEQLRIYLKVLCDGPKGIREPTLQYVALLDLHQLSLQNVNIDLFNWTIREVIPMFPGMVAGAFIMNYSWAHSGMWSIFKYIFLLPFMKRPDSSSGVCCQKPHYREYFSCQTKICWSSSHLWRYHKTMEGLYLFWRILRIWRTLNNDPEKCQRFPYQRTKSR